MSVVLEMYLMKESRSCRMKDGKTSIDQIILRSNLPVCLDFYTLVLLLTSVDLC